MLTWPVAYVEDCSAYAALPSDGDVSQEDFEQMAVELLWAWTGRMFGSREMTVRPCREPQREGTWFDMPRTPPRALRHPTTLSVQGWNAPCGLCWSGCLCRASTLALPSPVSRIVRIEMDGEELPLVAVRVDNRHLLVREDGGYWPTQDVSLPLGEPGTWAVTFMYGIEVPRAGQFAAGRLACELAKASLGDNSCELPRRFQSITRQGVTVAALDTFEDIEKGHTGIWPIDAWVSSVMKPPARSMVYSPDIPRKRRQTWP